MVFLVVWLASAFLGGGMAVNVECLLESNDLCGLHEISLCSLASITLYLFSLRE
jgi:hypothetical protein